MMTTRAYFSAGGTVVQDHRYSFEIDAAPEELWRLFWGRKKGDITEHGDVRIEILHPGDETGEGLIRHCHFRVPRYLLSGGVTRRNLVPGFAVPLLRMLDKMLRPIDPWMALHWHLTLRKRA